MVELSVVVATLESKRETPVHAALQRQSFTDFEVLFRDEYPVTRARNAGIEAAAADKIVFLDDDSQPTPGYLSRAAAVLDSEAAYMGLTLHPRNDVFARHFTEHYDCGTDPCYVDRFWGCNMGVRREVFDTVGGWDEQMGWGHEERELAMRVTAEFDVRYEPSLVVEHPYASSVVDYWRKQYRIERMRPYLWNCQGYSLSKQVAHIVKDLFNPLNYVRRTPVATAAQAGANLAKTAGRLRGYVETEVS